MRSIFSLLLVLFFAQTSDASLSCSSIFTSKLSGAEVLGRDLSIEDTNAIENAHRVGLGELGVDGRPAQVGSYTPSQILRKARVLAAQRFSTHERRLLMEAEIVGSWNGEVSLSSLTRGFSNSTERIVVQNGKLWLFGYGSAWNQWYDFPGEYFVENGRLYTTQGHQVVGIRVGHHLIVQ